jgi:hypothetical protein
MSQEPTEQGDDYDGLGGSIPLETKATFQRNPWRVKLYDAADVSAIKAVTAGTATPEQQQRAMQYIVVVLCATDDMSYRPGGEDGRRDTDFAEGARFVGNQIKRLAQGRMDELMKWVKSKHVV